jgi:type II secretion system protein G
MHAPGSARAGDTAFWQLVVVGLIIGAFVLVTAQRSVNRRQTEHRKITVANILAVQKALERYALDNGGRFPPPTPGLRALTDRPAAGTRNAPIAWRGPYAKREQLLDGWGHDLHYCLGGPGDPPPPYQLWSDGRDNSDGGVGLDADINVWKPDSLVP